MRNVVGLLLLILSLITDCAFASNQVVYFEPNIVKLEGNVRMLTFPGQPNYESIKHGDAEETDAYLILSKPIDIALYDATDIGNNAAVKNVKFIQLVVDREDDWKQIKEGNNVRIEGILFSALTGHHHARVLLRVNIVNVITKSEMMSKKLNITKEDRLFLKYQH
jgi:hypothetical protein